MKLSIVFLVLALLSLAGCATKHWTKPGVTAQDFHRDSFECAQQTLHSTETSMAPSFWFWSGGSTSSETKVSKELYRTCLQAKGYQLVQGGQWEGLRD